MREFIVLAIITTTHSSSSRCVDRPYRVISCHCDFCVCLCVRALTGKQGVGLVINNKSVINAALSISIASRVFMLRNIHLDHLSVGLSVGWPQRVL